MADVLVLGRQAAASDSGDAVRRARQGDVDAFEELVRAHERRVLRIAYHMVGNLSDAQDVAQDVFIRLWKYLDRIRDESKFSTWLYRMVMNASYDFLSRRRRDHEHVSFDDPALGPELSDGSIPVDRNVAGRELKEKVLGALDCLTPSERTVFVLRDIDGLEVKDIAEIHQISQVTVRRHLSTSRHKMRGVLAGLYPGFLSLKKEGDES